MKISVDQNETPFDRMTRQGFEWLDKYGKTAPNIIRLALEELKPIESRDRGEEQGEDSTSLKFAGKELYNHKDKSDENN